MADKDKIDTTKTDVSKLDDQAREDAEAAIAAKQAADEAALSDVEKAALEAKRRADDSAARAAEARAAAEAARTKDPTLAHEVKNVAVLSGDKEAGNLLASDHKAQKFANDPENPAPAPGLKPVEEGGQTRLELTDSDHPDPANPKVAYVHPDMVGDYLRAGWRYPVA